MFQFITQPYKERDKGREGHWNNKNITQTLSWQVRLKLFRRNIRVSLTIKNFSSLRKKKKRILSSYESGFEGRASIFFVLTITLTLGVPCEILPLAKDCEREL